MHHLKIFHKFIKLENERKNFRKWCQKSTKINRTLISMRSGQFSVIFFIWETKIENIENFLTFLNVAKSTDLPRICPVNIWTAFAVDRRFGRHVYMVILTISAQFTHPPIIPFQGLTIIFSFWVALESNQRFKNRNHCNSVPISPAAQVKAG